MKPPSDAVTVYDAQFGRPLVLDRHGTLKLAPGDKPTGTPFPDEAAAYEAIERTMEWYQDWNAKHPEYANRASAPEAYSLTNPTTRKRVHDARD